MADDSAVVSEEVDTPEQPESGEVTLARAQTYQGEYVTVAPLPQPAPPIQLTTGVTGLPEGSPIRQLAEAAEVARQRSITQLADWFPGYDFATAAQTSDDRRFTLLQIGDALTNYLEPLETIEDIIATHDLVGRQVSFSDGTKRAVEPDRVFDSSRPGVRRLRPGAVVDALTNQWTTILNGIDGFDPKISSVCGHLERVYGARVNTNVYVSYGHAQGFGPHWDEHDTIIVPVTGSKKWTVYEPATLSPLRPWVEPDVSPRPVWEGEVEPGMCLVIPRGWGHEVGGSDDLAIHYTLGVNRLTVNDVLHRLVVESGFSPMLRADIAYDPIADVTSYEQSIHDDEALLGTTIGDLATPELVGRAIATYRARMPLRQFPRLLDVWFAAGLNDWSGASIRLPVPAGIHPVLVTEAVIVVAFGDRRVDLTPAAFELVLALADTEFCRVEDLPLPDQSEQVRARICKELVSSGLADVRFAS